MLMSSIAQQLIRLYRHWTLPLAITTGTLAFVVARYTPALAPYHTTFVALAEGAMPTLIFTMLLLTFCRVSPTDLLPKRWQWWLLLVQVGLCAFVVGVSRGVGLSSTTLPIAQGVLACFIAPTATAAAVVTAKLTSPAEAGTVTVHALLQGLVVTLLIALFFPMMAQGATLDVSTLALRLITQSARLLLLPLALAWGLRYGMPRLHRALAERAGWGFYLWGVALALVTAQTLRLMTHSGSIGLVLLHALVALVACVCHFALGRAIGGRYGQAIPAGQALGQKNTIFAVWMAYTYLHPTAALAPGAYVLWQNAFNAWQLWRARRKGGV